MGMTSQKIVQKWSSFGFAGGRLTLADTWQGWVGQNQNRLPEGQV
jgi:hypothetical protein